MVGVSTVRKKGVVVWQNHHPVTHWPVRFAKLVERADDVLVNPRPPGVSDQWRGDVVEYYIGLYDRRPSDAPHDDYQGGDEPDYEIHIKANAGTVQTLIQAELADKNLNSREEAVDIAKVAGLHNPFNGVAMNTAGWFPESADVPGEIQITLSSGVFSIQGYGADGLLPDILTARR